MDNKQKQILGNLLLSIVVAIGVFLTGKLQLWFTDPSLLTFLGMVIAAIVYFARKWIVYSFGLPEEDIDTGDEVEDEPEVPP